MFSFVSCTSAFLAMFNAPSCHWELTEDGGGVDGAFVMDR